MLEMLRMVALLTTSRLHARFFEIRQQQETHKLLLRAQAASESLSEDADAFATQWRAGVTAGHSSAASDTHVSTTCT
jgi:hypothetical protein